MSSFSASTPTCTAEAALQRVRHHEQRGGLHLAGLDTQPLPSLPLVQQLVGHGHAGGAVLAVERVLALDDAHLCALAQRPGRLDQRGGDLEVRHRGVLDGGVFLTGVLKADRAGGHHHVAGLRTSRSMPPQVPTRRNVSAPMLCSSSMAMEADGPPIPVEQTETFSPSSVPV